MTTPDAPLTNFNAVDKLREDFRNAGYDAERVPHLLGADAHNALGRGHPWPALHATSRAAAEGSQLATLTRLFLLGTTEPASSIDAALPSLGLDGALECGLLEPVGTSSSHGSSRTGDTGDRIRAAVDIRPHASDEHSYLVVSDFDSDTRPGPVHADHVLGIGAASVMLARMVIRRPVQRVLDLGTGCGIQALHCSAHSTSITATDTNPRALALAGATARLNGQNWDLRQGSLFEPVADEEFDLIVSNPSFVISSGVRRFEYRDSGLVGDELCRRLVTGMSDHLCPGGTAQVLANWMIRADGDWRWSVGEWVAVTGCDGWVVQRKVAHPAEYVSLWLQDTGESLATNTEATHTAVQEIAGEWLDYFAREGVTGIGMGSITLRKPLARRVGTPDVIFDELTGADDILTGPEVEAFLARRAYLCTRSNTDLLDTTLSLAANDILEQRLLPGTDGWSPVLRLLRRPGGPGATVQLDEWGQALLAGCTGAVSLRTQVALLASAHNLNADALASAVLPAIRTAITRGLLHPIGIDN
ncbi:MAG: class I SAM-dependent methyltransferase [Nakamurella sp.]